MHWCCLLLVVVVLTADAIHARSYYSDQTTPQHPLVVDEKTGIQYNPYSKHHPGRHVCTNQKNVTHPVRTKQMVCKPMYKQYVIRCNGNQLCSGVRLVYEREYKDVVTTRNTNEITYSCCPGWVQINNRSHGCNKPICGRPCLNGGKCVRPGVCTCPTGFRGIQCEIPIGSDCLKHCQNGGSCGANGVCQCTKGFQGLYCEKDVDECKEHKPCDQICYNTLGSYRCECKESFILQNDGQSCRKENDEGTSFEAKDLEFELLDRRLLKLETMMDESHKNDATRNDIKIIYNDIETLTKDIQDVKNKMNLMESYKNDLHVFKTKLNVIERKATKIDDLLVKYERIKKCAFHNKICI